MKLGAVDFLEKPFEDDRLTSMIESAIHQAEPAAKSEAIAQDIAARVASLSPRERQVMEGLIAGLSNKLTAREYDISPRTVEVYRANVMTKMPSQQPVGTGAAGDARRNAQGLSHVKALLSPGC
ncbi:FixJ family two-component response regulator [Bradyrhizobium sp. LM2.7]